MKLWMMILALTLLSCGQLPPSDAIEGTGNPTDTDDSSSGWLYKNWKGRQVLKDPQTKLKPLPLQVVFEENHEFILNFFDDNAQVSGKYYLLTNHKILFEIKDSNLSLFGLASSQRTMSYYLQGNTLHIYDDQIELSLEETTEGSSIGSNGPRTIIGLWKCTQKDLEWRFEIDNKYRYSLTGTAKDSPILSINSEGFLAKNSDKTYSLSFHDGKEQKYFMKLQLQKEEKIYATIIRNAEEGKSETIDSFHCNKF